MTTAHNASHRNGNRVSHARRRTLASAGAVALAAGACIGFAGSASASTSHPAAVSPNLSTTGGARRQLQPVGMGVAAADRLGRP